MSKQNNKCPICGFRDPEIFFATQDIPVHCNVLHPTRELALNAPRGRMQLGFCRECGHLYNFAFDPDLMRYTPAYENSLHFSPRFQSYAEQLADRLIARYDLHNKTIVEIGCGKGEFLRLLCERGGNRGYGFDESIPAQGEGGGVTFVRDFFSEKYSHIRADFVCCRHVLEHISRPIEFTNGIARVLDPNASIALYFEVPNALWTLKDLGIWDLIYEHVSYFTASSLARLFHQCGFGIRTMAEMFEGQFLGAELTLRRSPVESALPAGHDLPAVQTLVSAFEAAYTAKFDQWRRHFDRMKAEGRRVVVWGAGSKGVMFLNMLRSHSTVEYVVDMNTRKHGMYVSGTGQKIVPPAFLRELSPDTIIIMNPIYKEEIGNIVKEMPGSPSLLTA